MKKFYSVFAMALALVAVGCNKGADVQSPVAEQSEPIRIVVGVESGSATKATGVVSNSESTEAKVNSLQVLVFSGDYLDGYGRSSNSKLATVSCTAGRREIYAVVNAPDLSNISSKTAFLATVSNLESNISNFQMIGSKLEENLSDGGNVTIYVDRLAARVVLKAIKNQVDGVSNFRIVSVYLTNVVGDIDYGMSDSYTPAVWYNKRGYQSSNNLGEFTYDNVGAAIAYGDTNSSAHFFYSYPNRFGSAVGGPFTPRAARLVVKVNIDGTVYDYPILLPSLAANNSYEINLLTITRLGNPDDGVEPGDDRPNDRDEEDPIEGLEKNFEIVVNPWNVVLVNGDGNVTI